MTTREIKRGFRNRIRDRIPRAPKPGSTTSQPAQLAATGVSDYISIKRKPRSRAAEHAWPARITERGSKSATSSCARCHKRRNIYQTREPFRKDHRVEIFIAKK